MWQVKSRDVFSSNGIICNFQETTEDTMNYQTMTTGKPEENAFGNKLE